MSLPRRNAAAFATSGQRETQAASAPSYLPPVACIPHAIPVMQGGCELTARSRNHPRRNAAAFATSGADAPVSILSRRASTANGKDITWSAAAIRRAVRGQEALTYRQSAMEYDPKSELARDYYDLVKDVWARVLKAEK